MNDDRKIQWFYVYIRTVDQKESLYISEKRKPRLVVRKKPLYIGKKAKIKALETLGYSIESTTSSSEINDIITKFYNSSMWNLYHERFKEFATLKFEIKEQFEYLYTIEIETKKSNITNSRLIKFILAELEGSPLQYYKKIPNPIISIKG